MTPNPSQESATTSPVQLNHIGQQMLPSPPNHPPAQLISKLAPKHNPSTFGGDVNTGTLKQYTTNPLYPLTHFNPSTTKRNTYNTLTYQKGKPKHKLHHQHSPLLKCLLLHSLASSYIHHITMQCKSSPPPNPKLS